MNPLWKLGVGAIALMSTIPAARAVGAPRARYDFDGDLKDDIAVFVRSTATWYIKLSTTGAKLQQQWGDANSVPVPGDYNGDGKTDIAVFNKFNGNWSILFSGVGGSRVQHWGDPDSFPVPGDYDADGKTDIAVFYRTSAEWVILQSANGGTRSEFYGGLDGRPVPADYDGDGKTDLAFYLPGFALWQIRQSASGQIRQVFIGNAETRPAVGYFDSDNKADVATYQAANGQWQIVDSTTGRLRKVGFGALLAGSAPGDFDGDGRSDITVYAPSQGRWYISQSSNGQLRQQNWGAPTARPVPAYEAGAIEDLRIHAHGDSITYGKSSSSDGPSTGYPLLLEKSLEGGFGGDITSLNFGSPGETTRNGLERLPWDLLGSRAKILLLMEGTNDHFYQNDFDAIEANLREMVRIGQSQGKFVIIATIPPCVPSQRPDQHNRIVDFNPRIYDIAADFHIPVARVFESITGVPGWENSLMDHGTGNHPNDLGYQYVRAAFEAALASPLINGQLY